MTRKEMRGEQGYGEDDKGVVVAMTRNKMREEQGDGEDDKGKNGKQGENV